MMDPLFQPSLIRIQIALQFCIQSCPAKYPNVGRLPGQTVSYTCTHVQIGSISQSVSPVKNLLISEFTVCCTWPSKTTRCLYQSSSIFCISGSSLFNIGIVHHSDKVDMVKTECMQLQAHVYSLTSFPVHSIAIDEKLGGGGGGGYMLCVQEHSFDRWVKPHSRC